MLLSDKLILGTAQFGLDYGVANKDGKLNLMSADNIISYARQKGVDRIDTAINYGDSESLLGKIGVREFEVTTKISLPPDSVANVYKWVEYEISQSLKRIGYPKIYNVLIHDASIFKMDARANFYKALVDLKDAGVIKKIGVSIYDPNELNEITENYSIDMVQAPYNVFDRRMQASGWLNKLNQLGVEFQARSIFLQGLLLMDIKKMPRKFSKWFPLFKLFEEWNITNNFTALQSCVIFVLLTLNINNIVIGVDNLSQLKEILSLNNAVPDELTFPDLFIEDSSLINPSLWRVL